MLPSEALVLLMEMSAPGARLVLQLQQYPLGPQPLVSIGVQVPDPQGLERAGASRDVGVRDRVRQGSPTRAAIAEEQVQKLGGPKIWNMRNHSSYLSKHSSHLTAVGGNFCSALGSLPKNRL